MPYFDYAIQELEWLGLTDVILPFLLIFTIIFAIMQKFKFLGEGRKNFNVMIALIIGLLVVVPHINGTYPPEKDVVVIMNEAIPNVSILLIAIIMLLLLVGIWGVEINWAGSSLPGVLAFLSFIAVALIFSNAVWPNWLWPDWLWWLRDSATQSTIVIILVFAVLIWFITKEPSKPEQSGLVHNFFNSFRDMWKK